MQALILGKAKTLPVYQEYDLPMQEDWIEVQLMASALNHRDVWITKGMYPGIKYPIILGSDGAGIHQGKDVLINPGMFWGHNQRYQATDFEILGLPHHGTFAQACLVPEKYIHPIPDHLDHLSASALPLAGLTAYRALFSRCGLTPEDTVLVSGIGGGVALFAMQFALATGCRTIVTSSSEWKRKKALEMGAAAAYDYRDRDWGKQLQEDFVGVDVVIDSAAGDGFAVFPKICLPGGRICFYGGTRGKINGLNPQVIFWKQLSIHGSTMGSEADFVEMLDLVSKYRIVPVIDEVIPLSAGRRGFEKLEAGKQFGKIVFNHA